MMSGSSSVDTFIIKKLKLKYWFLGRFQKYLESFNSTKIIKITDRNDVRNFQLNTEYLPQSIEISI